MNYHAAKAYILNRLERELPAYLTYHSLEHTRDVLWVSEELCRLEHISPHDTLLVKTAALYHDSGFLNTRTPELHESISARLVRKVLPRYDYLPKDIETIAKLIMATRVPQCPNNKLEAILCDADLDYLGRPDFHYRAKLLYKELIATRQLPTGASWNQIQIRFLERHHYFTPSNIKRRRERKARHLLQLKATSPSFNAPF